MEKVHFSIKSNRICIDCGQPLKANLINRKPSAKRCYKCHILQWRKRVEI